MARALPRLARSQPGSTNLVSASLLGLTFFGLAVVMAYPHLGSFARGTPGDYGDPYFTQWLLRWDWHSLLSSPGHLFDTNIFWPTRGTLVYADTMLPAAVVTGGLSVVLGWTVALNFVYLATWVASLAAMYQLSMWFFSRRMASILAAIVFTFAAPRLAHYGHFQLDFAFLIPLTTWLLLRFLAERAWWQAACVGLLTACTALTAVYYALVLAITMAVLLIGWLVATSFRPGPRFFAGLTLAAVIVIALAGPVVYRYQHLQNDPRYRRPYLADFAAAPGDFVSARNSRLYGVLDRAILLPDRGVEHQLFPGALALSAGALGFGAWRRSRRRGLLSEDPDRGRGLTLMMVAGMTVLVLAFGKYQTVAGKRIWLPYALLHDHVPGFENVRAIGRFSVVPLMVLALLVACAFVWFADRVQAWVALSAGLVVALVMLAEYSTPINTTHRVDGASSKAVNVALTNLPLGAVVELPMGGPYVEAPRMALSTIDWRPRVNGYSGFASPGYLPTVDLMNSLADGVASPAVLDRLAELRVSYIVLRTAPVTRGSAPLDIPGVAFYDVATVNRVLRALPSARVAMVKRFGDAVLVELRR